MIELINRNSLTRFKMSMQRTIKRTELRKNEIEALQELKEEILMTS